MKVIDPTGVELSPGEPEKCLGNGEHVDDEGHDIECCCDECDYFLLCHPQYCTNDYLPANLDKKEH